jgi:serine/threonine protein phosphatase PrpC
MMSASEMTSVAVFSSSIVHFLGINLSRLWKIGASMRWIPVNNTCWIFCVFYILVIGNELCMACSSKTTAMPLRNYYLDLGSVSKQKRAGSPGRKAENQDRLYVYDSGKNPYSLLAIFDGHGVDAQIPTHAVDEWLPKTMVPLIPTLEKLDGIELSNHITNAFDEYDKRWHAKAYAGTTATLAILDPKRLVFAHVGDSKAVLARGLGVTVATEDHNPLPGSSEEKRILAEGGLIRDGRLVDAEILFDSASYALSRSIGDFHAFKDSFWKFRGMSATPAVIEIALSSRDEFIILASDGFWNHVPVEEALSLARAMFFRQATAQEVAEALTNRGLRNDSIRHCFYGADSKTALSGPRDDMTIIVARILWQGTSKKVSVAPKTVYADSGHGEAFAIARHFVRAAMAHLEQGAGTQLLLHKQLKEYVSDKLSDVKACPSEAPSCPLSDATVNAIDVLGAVEELRAKLRGGSEDAIRCQAAAAALQIAIDELAREATQNKTFDLNSLGELFWHKSTKKFSTPLLQAMRRGLIVTGRNLLADDVVNPNIGMQDALGIDHFPFIEALLRPQIVARSLAEAFLWRWDVETNVVGGQAIGRVVVRGTPLDFVLGYHPELDYIHGMLELRGAKKMSELR